MDSAIVTDMEAIRKAYCPPLDDSLFYAVALDYDLQDEEQNSALVRTLEELKEAAVLNEAISYDRPTTDPSLSGLESKTRTTKDGHSSSHDVTSVTSDFSNLNLSHIDDGLGEDLDHYTDLEKLKYLRNLFPRTSSDDIHSALRSCTSMDAAVDELLNIAFISTHSDEHSEKDVPASKGIEGFAEELRPERGRKRRNKKKNRTTDSSRTNSTGSFRTEIPSTGNAWSNASEDVDFICARISLSATVVSSIYHRQRANLADTIRELSDREKAKLPPFEEADPIVRMQVTELREDFPNISPLRIQALLHLARNIPSATWELLEATIDKPAEDDLPPGKLHGIVQYAPVNLDDSPTDYVPSSHTSTSAYINPHANHSSAASTAFSSASTAARRARSDKLMGGAAAYYASIGHEHIKLAKAESAAAADALVARQSSRTMIDLHGVSVSDAVRIAHAKTNAWWTGLGDAKYTGAGGGRDSVKAGFQIVTGVGTHSRNNAPRIGPAVAKALVREGWKVEVGHGEMYVTGKARR